MSDVKENGMCPMGPCPLKCISTERNNQCSGEIPCKTCASVVSARVWKLDCMRTSIYKEVDIFRIGAFYTHRFSISALNIQVSFVKLHPIIWNAA